MKTDTFRGRDFLTLLDYTKEEVKTILDVAQDLKRRFATGDPHDQLLRSKTLFMIFYNQSLRTWAATLTSWTPAKSTPQHCLAER
jgi:N-acetylornithine carbamoyltransferase